MSMLDSKGEVRPVVLQARSGLVPDGPDWDPGIDMSGEVSMTKQSFAEECDINSIMARYEKTGLLPQGSRMFEFGDAISEYSYQESMNAVIEADRLFSELPSRIRERFGNDPAQLFAFLDDRNNLDEAIKLGLVDPPKPKAEPLEVRVVPDPTPPKPDGA